MGPQGNKAAARSEPCWLHNNQPAPSVSHSAALLGTPPTKCTSIGCCVSAPDLKLDPWDGILGASIRRGFAKTGSCGCRGRAQRHLLGLLSWPVAARLVAVLTPGVSALPCFPHPPNVECSPCPAHRGLVGPLVSIRIQKRGRSGSSEAGYLADREARLFGE